VKETVSDYRNIQQYNETALQDAVANVGPIAIAIDSSSWTFQFYSSGLFLILYLSANFMVFDALKCKLKRL
jgi:hypothetical protein